MRAYARLANATAIKQRLAQLAKALDEIDIEVSDETRDLARSLLRELSRSEGRSRETSPPEPT